ncbi:MAG TPA: hypothetical protein VFA67_09090 [Candidatus Sulfotelmatobacter sp.]|jgi:hypothetical protein|nr:hypothetical protein [Candidatus Sulfotelmatobacter sp.]
MTLRAPVRTHYFHANASAIGGYIERPFVKNIPVQSPTSLSPSGGADEAATTAFQFEKIITAHATRSRVEGSHLAGLPVTRAMAAVEGLNVLDTIRADELVGYISTEHPAEDPDVPKVDLSRTVIDGLRVGEAILRVHLDTKILGSDNSKQFPKRPHLFEKSLWKRADRKFDPDKGILVCTLVEKIEVVRGKLSGKIVDTNIIEIPNIGRMHLAELVVTGKSLQLIMMRLELGCPVVGSTSACAPQVNGGGYP